MAFLNSVNLASRAYFLSNLSIATDTRLDEYRHMSTNPDALRLIYQTRGRHASSQLNTGSPAPVSTSLR
jgi:hypothetical protein